MSNLKKTVTPLGPGRYGYSLSDITGFSRASTGTYIDSGGIIRAAAVNEARFEAGQLLLEGQSANYVTNSESSTIWFNNTPNTPVPGAVLGGNGTVVIPGSVAGDAPNVRATFPAGNIASGTPIVMSIMMDIASVSDASIGFTLFASGVSGVQRVNGVYTFATKLLTLTPVGTTITAYRGSFGPVAGTIWQLQLSVTLSEPMTACRLYPKTAATTWTPTMGVPSFEPGRDTATSYIVTGGAVATRAADYASLIQYQADAPGSLTMSIDGNVISATGALRDPLTRAVIISLFTWGRARADDQLPGDDRMGWWGDTYPATPGDRIGSRLWLLSRSTITAKTVQRAREYAEEALAWLVADGVASEVIVLAEREGQSQISLWCQIVRGNGPRLDIRFNDAWSFLNGI